MCSLWTGNNSYGHLQPSVKIIVITKIKKHQICSRKKEWPASWHHLPHTALLCFRQSALSRCGHWTYFCSRTLYLMNNAEFLCCVCGRCVFRAWLSQVRNRTGWAMPIWRFSFRMSSTNTTREDPTATLPLNWEKDRRKLELWSKK